MRTPEKVCPIVSRDTATGLQILAFQHPLAGRQFVKGGIHPGEDAQSAAQRELFEESGLRIPQDVPQGLHFRGTAQIGTDGHGAAAPLWHLFHGVSHGLPDTWSHDTLDDHGHRFAFFWHPLDQALDDGWHLHFHQAFRAIKAALG